LSDTDIICNLNNGANIVQFICYCRM